MEAAYNGKADIVSLLLAAGADIEAKNIVSKRINKNITHTNQIIISCVSQS